MAIDGFSVCSTHPHLWHDGIGREPFLSCYRALSGRKSGGIPLATIPMGIILLVAIFTVHLPNGFSSIKLQSFDAAGAHFGQPGYETDLLYLAGLIALCLGGAGPFSIDGLLSRFKSTR